MVDIYPNNPEYIRQELKRLVHNMRRYTRIPNYKKGHYTKALAQMRFLSRADMTKENARGKDVNCHLAMCLWMLRYHEDVTKKYPQLSKDVYLNVTIHSAPPHMFYPPAAIAYITDELIEHTQRLDQMIAKIENRKPKYRPC